MYVGILYIHKRCLAETGEGKIWEMFDNCKQGKLCSCYDEQLVDGVQEDCAECGEDVADEGEDLLCPQVREGRQRILK